MTKRFKFAVLLVVIVFPAAACSTAAVTSPRASANPGEVVIERGFVPGPYGPVHYRRAQPPGGSDGPALVLFHPSPFSSAYYLDFMALVAQDRVVIALDTPGYGDSERPPEPLSIEEYAAALDQALSALGYVPERGAQMDLLGFHTGTLLAVELALARPQTVRRIVLAGVPFVTGEERRKSYQDTANPTPVIADGTHLNKTWKFVSGSLKAGMSLNRVQDSFNDATQCLPHCWWAYHGVFTYRSEERFAQVQQPVLLISEPVSLTAETQAAVPLFENGQHRHLADYPRSGFKTQPQIMANAAKDYLDQPLK